MSDNTMPDRIWVTGEHSMWPTFRSFNATDLDHSNDDGTSDYQEYVRADLVPAPAVPDDVARLREALEEIDRNIPEYYTECFGIRAIVRAALTHPTGDAGA